MEWKVVSERPLYQDEWLDIRIADVQTPDGTHLQHRSIRTPPGAGAVVLNSEKQVMLLWRHRFITRSWGWEIPLGKIETANHPTTLQHGSSRRKRAGGPGPCGT